MQTTERGEMAKGVATADWVETLVKDTYAELMAGGREAPARDVKRAVELQLIKDPNAGGHVGRFLPSLRKCQEVIAKIRPAMRDGLRSPEEEDTRRWSIGASARYGISSQSIPWLMDIQEWCYITGQHFSIRQAIWGSRLREFLETFPVERKHYWCKRYANRELISKAAGEPSVDTKDLDAFLYMLGSHNSNLYHAFLMYGTVSRMVHSTGIADGGTLDADPVVDREIAEVLGAYVGEDNPAVLTIRNLGLMPSSLIAKQEDKLKTEEQRKLYSHNLNYVSKGKKWLALDKASQIAIADKLLEWIVSPPFSPRPEPRPETIPRDILEEVGQDTSLFAWQDENG